MLVSIVSWTCIIVGSLWLALEWYLWRRIHKIRHIETNRMIPVPSFLQELWIFIQIGFKLRSEFNPTDDMLKKRKAFGPIFALWRGLSPVIVVSEPADVKKVLIEKDMFEKEEVFAANHTLNRIFGRSLLAISGDQWKQQRKGMDPAFKLKRLKDLVPTFALCARRLTDYWDKELANSNNKDSVVKVWPGVSRMTLDAIGLGGFSHDFKALENGIDSTLHHYKTIIQSLFRPALIFFPWLVKLPTPYNNKLNHSFSEMDRLLYTVIKDHMENQGDNQSDILAHILALGGSSIDLMSQTEIRDNLFLFFVAGHDTSSSALTSSLYFLSLYPEVQQRAYEEVIKILGDNTDPTYDDLMKFEYLRDVLRESMRLHPPIEGTTSRVCMKEGVTLGGYTVPPGTEVIPLITLVNYNEDRWQEPYKFNPDRWANAKADPLNFLSFGAGPRICIGRKFAILEVTCALALILQRYELSCMPEYEWKYKPVSLALRPADGLPLKLRLRNSP